jgi:Ser/Thr protein kinase RdoA (MazF antagonist)
VSPAEIALTGGRTTAGVVKIGDTVRRPIGPHSPFVHRLLQHLESKGFAGAPRFRSIDSSGREILSFIPGEVPPELGPYSDGQLAAAARLLRALHDAASDCDLRGDREIVCHGDISPCNCVFVNAVPTAFIDFDTAHPGDRREDVGYGAWLWVDMGDDDLPPDVQGARLARFVDGYGFPRAEALPAVLDAQAELAARAVAPAHVRAWAVSCRKWVDDNFSELSRAVASAGA